MSADTNSQGGFGKGKPKTLTPEQRAAQAERMRAVQALARKAGHFSKPRRLSPEQREAKAKILKANRREAMLKKQDAWLESRQKLAQSGNEDPMSKAIRLWVTAAIDDIEKPDSTDSAPYSEGH